MASYLGINFLGNWLVAAEVRGNGAKPSVRKIHAAKLPSELSHDSAESLGKWLKGELSSHGFSANDVVCTLGRNFLSSKLVRVPTCPEHELPAIVSFAVEGELHAPLGTSVLDFQVGQTAGGEQEVFAALAPSSTVEALTSMLRNAGLNLKHLCPRAYATHFLWQHETVDKPEAVLLVSAGSEALNITLWFGECLQLSRFVPLSAEDDPVTRASLEARRTLAAFHSTRSSAHQLRIALCGFPSAQAAKEIATATGEKVDCFGLGDSWKMPPPSLANLPDGESLAGGGELVAAVGAALAESQDYAWPIDFLHPKQVVVPRNRKRTLAILGGALAAVVVLATVFYVRGLFRDRDDRIKLYADQLTNLNQQLAALRPTLERHRIIKDWAAAEQDWLGELAELSSTFPDTSQAFLTSLELYAGQSGKPGSMKLEGKAAKQTVVTAAQREWANDADPHYKVTPRGMDPIKESPQFPWRFGLDLVTATTTVVEPGSGEKWAQASAQLEPEGKKRIELALDSKGASVAPSSDTASASSARESKESKKELKKAAKREAKEGTDAEEPADPAARLVAKLKGLSPEQREAEIAKAPKFLQNRIRKMIKEQGQ